MTLEKLMLDVNVPMYAAGKAHKYKEPCTWIMQEIGDNRLQAVIDTETIQEVLYRYAAIRRYELAVTISRELLIIIEDVLPISTEHLHLAIDLFGSYGTKGIPPRDILHVAVMILADIKKIISTDSHFDQIEGIERIDPLILFDRKGLMK